MKQSTKFGLKLAGVIGAATYAGTLLGGLSGVSSRDARE